MENVSCGVVGCDTQHYRKPEQSAVLDGGEIGTTVTPKFEDFETAEHGRFPKFAEDVHNVFTDAYNVLLQKHQDYGPKNISGSPGGPLNGLRVRMHDKLARVNNLLDSGAEPENESLRDSFLDLMNYSAIAMLVLDGNWPSE